MHFSASLGKSFVVPHLREFRPLDICCLAALVIIVLAASGAQAQTAPPKPRLLVTTDIGGDPDDQQSMRRLMLYANEFELAGLIASSAGVAGELPEPIVRPDLIRAIVDDYETAQLNLSSHASGYPTAATLRGLIKSGARERGVASIGAGRSTEGSDQIIAAVDGSNSPLHVAIWGGAHDLAQALYDVRETRTAADLSAFVAKLRVYAIRDQDKGTSAQGTGEWIRANFPALRYVETAPPGTDGFTGVFRGMYQNDSTGGGRPTVQLVETDRIPLNQSTWVETNIRNGHGALGAGYPLVAQNPPSTNNTTGVKEGDTPSWFYVLPNGLQDPEEPTWGGWGGRFRLDEGQHYIDAEDTHWSAAGNADFSTRRKWTVARWREAYQNDFAARMDRSNTADYADANHPPIAAFDDDEGRQIVRLSAISGDTVALSAFGSSDPEGDALSYEWFQYVEAGTYPSAVSLSGATARDASFVAPSVEAPATLHIILAVTDDGSPSLTSYRRVVVTISPDEMPVAGLIGYWPMDEGGGLVTADATANEATGRLINRPAWVTGQIGAAIDFDGINDRVDLGNRAHLRLTGAMSLSAWVWVDDFAGNGRIVNKQGPRGRRGWSLNIEEGGFASFQVAANRQELVLLDGTTLPTQQWIHLTGTYEPGVAMSLYVNGALDASRTSGVPGSQHNSDLAVSIGDRPTGGTPFNGRIDEVRIYGRALSPAEVQQLQ
jgi:hypothetical protein